MHRKSFIRLAAVAVAVLISSLVCAGPSRIKWQSSYDAAVAASRKSHKPLMVDFSTSWCGWCTKLNSETFSDKGVISLSSKFVCLRVAGDSNHGLCGTYNVTGYPTVVFIYNKQVIGRVVGFTPPGPFAQTMRDALTNAKSKRTKLPPPPPAS